MRNKLFAFVFVCNDGRQYDPGGLCLFDGDLGPRYSGNHHPDG